MSLHFYRASYFIFFCSKLSIAIEPVVLVMFDACPSHIIFSYFYYVYSRFIRVPSDPKMSGRLRLKF